MKLGFIGSGKMATALIHGVIKAGVCKPGDILASDSIAAIAEKLAKETGIAAAANNAEVFAASDAIVLAVKPGDALAAIQQIPGKAR